MNGRKSLPAYRSLMATACLTLLFQSAAILAQSLGQGRDELRAPVFDATNLLEPTDLAATWLVHAGDDPSYAQPDFDDSEWIPFDSTKDLRELFPQSHPEIVWYRLRVKVLPKQSGLALKEVSLSSAFEIYTNGVLLIHLGQVKPFIPYTYFKSLIERVPDAQIATGSLVIALRVRIAPTDWNNPGTGFYAPNLTLGRERELREQFWITLVGGYAGYFLNSLFSLGLGLVALTLFIAQRGHREYLWIFLQFLTHVLHSIFLQQLDNLPQRWTIVGLLVSAAAVLFLLLMYFALLGIRFGWRMWVLFAAAAIPYVGPQYAGNSIPAVYAGITTYLLFLLTYAVIFIVLIVHFRRGNREAGLLLIPVFLWSLSIIAESMRFFLLLSPTLAPRAAPISNFLFAHQIGPFTLSFLDISQFLYLVSLTIIIVARSTRMSRKQAVLENEVAATREVQQVILPEQIEAIAGFAIESVYQPAQQVGGDFFQILPTEDNGLLLVVGDVAGKGLPAAMLVSLLVGAIRTAAEDTSDPALLLSRLNERLIGRSRGGFSTALAAHIAADGTVTIANAGHLSPYLDGTEMGLPGALPLGIVSGTIYETTQFQLAIGSRLTFYSDGVIEAQNGKGELFGFERGRDISTQPAVEIADAAKQFGQSDDITVVAITRTAAIAEAA